ncbi:hypothetical protein V6N13_002905 [Hibiscus sabdariffa]|uniref:Peptidase M10 metallopeptidase domain-containing protein n=1 Tax=Hibiscus sabdariffa TaxID=183260 RepID=A0ABR2A2I0_9ROSI
MPSGLNRENVTSVMDAAFRKWQDVVPEFTFQRVYPDENADIKISFTILNNNLYGYGYYPPDGGFILILITHIRAPNHILHRTKMIRCLVPCMK